MDLLFRFLFKTNKCAEINTKKSNISTPVYSISCRERSCAAFVWRWMFILVKKIQKYIINVFSLYLFHIFIYNNKFNRNYTVCILCNLNHFVIETCLLVVLITASLWSSNLLRLTLLLVYLGLWILMVRGSPIV